MNKKVTPLERKEAQAPIGRLVKLIARHRGLSITAIAEKMDMRDITLHNKLSGKAPLEMAELMMLADILDVSPVDLLHDPDEFFDGGLSASRWIDVDAGQSLDNLAFDFADTLAPAA